jgi:NAD/NADP transhydrogenase alpha subunit
MRSPRPPPWSLKARCSWPRAGCRDDADDDDRGRHDRARRRLRDRAGVAGLQAIATARRLGAVVEAYDVRPAVKEQIHSLGAKFVELPLETAAAEDKGGYAKAQDEGFYRRQRELLTTDVAESDVVIAAAAVPGKKARFRHHRDAARDALAR